MGAEQDAMAQLTIWAAGGHPTSTNRGTTPNQVMLACAQDLVISIDTHNKSQAEFSATSFINLLKLQTDPSTPRFSGLYAIPPGPRGFDRDECRTTSHGRLWYAAIGVGLAASSPNSNNSKFSYSNRDLLHSSLLLWLEQDMHWCYNCYTPLGVVAACSRAYDGKNNLIATSPDRDFIYHLLAGIELDKRDIKSTLKPDNQQQLGSRLIYMCLQSDSNLHSQQLSELAEKVKTNPSQLSKPKFWTAFNVARSKSGRLATWCPDGSPGVNGSSFASYDPTINKITHSEINKSVQYEPIDTDNVINYESH